MQHYCMLSTVLLQAALTLIGSIAAGAFTKQPILYRLVIKQSKPD
jgi:hypothetical protein